MCMMKHRSTKHVVRRSLEPAYTSKKDAPKGETTQMCRRLLIYQFRVSLEVADHSLGLLHGDAFKKETTP